MKMTGKAALMECLKAEGITNVYGNPGPIERPIMEEIVRHKELRYLMNFLMRNSKKIFLLRLQIMDLQIILLLFQINY